MLVVSSVTTTQAYNAWGRTQPLRRDRQVGTPATGLRGQLRSTLRFGVARNRVILGDTWDVVTMLESQGVDVTYATDIDLQAASPAPE